MTPLAQRVTLPRDLQVRGSQRKGPIWDDVEEKGKERCRPWRDWISFREQKDEQSPTHRSLPELLPRASPASDSADETDEAHAASLEESGRKQASRQKINIPSPYEENRTARCAKER